MECLNVCKRENQMEETGSNTFQRSALPVIWASISCETTAWMSCIEYTNSDSSIWASLSRKKPFAWNPWNTALLASADAMLISSGSFHSRYFFSVITDWVKRKSKEAVSSPAPSSPPERGHYISYGSTLFGVAFLSCSIILSFCLMQCHLSVLKIACLCL